ncbi:MAG: hypothetical protein ACHQWV_03760 [Nitrospirales bacterium]
MTHTAHHRGQQLALLRMLGREEYSNYGPTADTGGLMQNHAPTLYAYPSLEALLRGGPRSPLPPAGDQPVTAQNLQPAGEELHTGLSRVITDIAHLANAVALQRVEGIGVAIHHKVPRIGFLHPCGVLSFRRVVGLANRLLNHLDREEASFGHLLVNDRRRDMRVTLGALFALVFLEDRWREGHQLFVTDRRRRRQRVHLPVLESCEWLHH